MGTTRIRQAADKIVLQNHLAAFIPMKELVGKLLQLPEVWYLYTHAHASIDGLQRDLCDSSYVQNHKLTKEGKNWLQFNLSHNDLEMQNPLRSNKLHKMSMLFFTLGNFLLESRSLLQNIFVTVIARSKDVKKFALHHLLGDICEMMKNLQNGVFMKIHGERKLILVTWSWWLWTHLQLPFWEVSKESACGDTL